MRSRLATQVFKRPQEELRPSPNRLKIIILDTYRLLTNIHTEFHENLISDSVADKSQPAVTRTDGHGLHIRRAFLLRQKVLKKIQFVL